MRKINKKKIKYVFILVCMFSLGMYFQYISAHSKVTGELEQLTNEIKLAKENNKQLEREIVNLHKEIEQYKDKELSRSTDKTNTSDTMNTAEVDTTEHYSDVEYEEQQDSTPNLSHQEQAINLVKSYIGYSNEANVHFDVIGNVSGSEDLTIQVYEIVVDEGESQHSATWGCYGVNLETGKVYEINH